jgi:ketosteroid isomerase-like protein
MRATSLAGVAFAAALAAPLCAACGKGGASPTDPQAPVAVATPKAVIAGAKGAIESWRQAYEVRSVEALEKLYPHDLDVVVVQQGVPLIGWSSVDAMIKDRLARATEIHIKLKDVHISLIAPDVAAAVATMTRDVTDGVTSVGESGTLSLVLHKSSNTWLIAAEHYSYRPRQ